ncbi:MAG: YbjN domain-containing protein [Limnothrix sp. BL-A-16]|jgi:hypothetical protein
MTTAAEEALLDMAEEPTSAIETIETVISSLATENSAMVNRSGGSSLWRFQYGSVEVYVQLTGETDDDTLTVWSSVLNLPVKDEAGLLKKLMAANWLSTFEARYAIAENSVVVTTTRTVAELSPGEISRSITLVASIADDNDEALQAEFG